MTKIRNFDILGACIYTLLPHGPLPRAKFHVYQGNMSPLWGKKPIFGLLSNNNTSMAALRAGLPVTRSVHLQKFLAHLLLRLKVVTIYSYEIK